MNISGCGVTLRLDKLLKLTTWVEKWRFFAAGKQNKVEPNDYLSRFLFMSSNASVDFSRSAKHHQVNMQFPKFQSLLSHVESISDLDLLIFLLGPFTFSVA